MTSRTEVSVSWSQALAWRMERHLLNPVGEGSVAEVVARLGAVPSMDESMAELAVRTRRTTSRAGELAAASSRDLVTRKAHLVIHGGIVCGTWVAKGQELTVRWRDEGQPPQEAIEQEAKRLTGILGRDLSVRLIAH